jgi:hypothetical protein
MSFGPYSVDLVSEGKPAERSSAGFKAPRSKAQSPFKQQVSIAKTEAPPAPEVPSTIETEDSEEPITEDTIRDVTQPPAITFIPEEPKKIEPKKEPMIAKAELPAVELKPESEKKPEPPKIEPVILHPPPETKPKVTIKELPLPKEPEQVKPTEPKPSKADTTEEPARAEFPVKQDEKAEEVLPSAKTEKIVETKLPIVPSAASIPKTETEDLKVAKTKTETSPVSNVQVKTGKKSSKKRGTGASAKGKASSQKTEIASPSARNDTTDGSSGNQENALTTATGKSQTAGITLPEAEKPKEEPKQKPPLGIAVSDALFYRDIKIELLLKQADASTIEAKLYKKTHPSVNEYGKAEQKSVDLTADSGTEGKIIFSVAKAEKGIYTFVMQNTGENLQKTSLMIRLLEGKKGARNRKFETINIRPHAELTFKFILPEGIFWDDETYFTGSIESSDNITKFNDATGIVWKENKE